jgi:DNA-binding XRE family transcriptional regulator
MNADELKKLRNNMRWTQQELADALGMSRKSIVEMEAERAPIEQRTAIAARALADRLHTIWGTARRDMGEREGDVPIREAQIIWDHDGNLDPPVKVMRRGDRDDTRYDASFGCCNAGWEEMSDVGRLLCLYARMNEVVLKDGVDPAAMHAALSVIPEYRQTHSAALDIDEAERV